MLYTINKGNVSDYQDGQEPIIHLVSNIDLVISQNSQFVYTDRHAELSHAEYSNNLDAIERIVDFAVMKEIYWHNTPDDPDRKERRQAEFLVFRFFH